MTMTLTLYLKKNEPDDPVYWAESMKKLRPKKFPRITALSPEEQMKIKQIRDKNVILGRFYPSLKDFLVIYEGVLEKLSTDKNYDVNTL